MSEEDSTLVLPTTSESSVPHNLLDEASFNVPSLDDSLDIEPASVGIGKPPQTSFVPLNDSRAANPNHNANSEEQNVREGESRAYRLRREQEQLKSMNETLENLIETFKGMMEKTHVSFSFIPSIIT